MLFLAVAAVAPRLPGGSQWGLIGMAWWGAMFIPGLSMYLERRRRAQDGTTTEIL